MAEITEMSAEMTVTDSAKKARLYTLKLLTHRDRTERDLRLKLKDALYSDEDIEQAVNYVKDFGYLDDTRYAFNYIRMSSGRLGRTQLKLKLSEKGVASENIEEAFRQASEEGFIDENTEYELIEKLLRKKHMDLGAIDKADRDKLYASFYRKGFAVADVEKVLRSFLT